MNMLKERFGVHWKLKRTWEWVREERRWDLPELVGPVMRRRLEPRMVGWSVVSSQFWVKSRYSLG